MHFVKTKMIVGVISFYLNVLRYGRGIESRDIEAMTPCTGRLVGLLYFKSGRSYYLYMANMAETSSKIVITKRQKLLFRELIIYGFASDTMSFDLRDFEGQTICTL